MTVLGNLWRYPLDNNFTHQEILAEIVAHAISRIETLKGKDSICVAEEYREWLGEDFENDVMALHKIKYKS